MIVTSGGHDGNTQAMTLGYFLQTESFTRLKHQKGEISGLLPVLDELWPQDSSTYPMLSESDLLSPTYYGPEDLNELVDELELLALQNPENAALKGEIASLIDVAHMCMERKELLVISPSVKRRL